MIDVRRLRNKIEEVPGLLDMYNDELYVDWLENHSERTIRRWLIDNDYNIESCITIEYILYIAKHYLDWHSNNE